ncbi:MAG: polysaccharide deacetylase [Rhodospirillales bacterium]|nr:polysaccharide deacetylase [Rhodospirillales bacterium]
MIKNPVPWPDGAKCAAAITFDIDTDSILHLEHRERADTMLSSLSWLKYDEVAIPRILDMYRECGIKQTFFYPAWCMERYPHLVEMILKDDHEIAAHGYIHEDPNKLPREEEHYWLRRQIDVIEKMTGQRPRGWRGPLYNASKYSVDLLIEEGLIYDATLMGDDVPYVLKTAQGSVIELPSHWAMDDWPHYTHSFDFNYMMTIKSPDEAMNVFMSEFEAMYDFGGLWVTVWHPFVSGRLARCRRVQQMIEYMQGKGGVWFTTLEEIAKHVQTCIDDGSWTPRVDNLPYYDGLVPELERLAAE